MSDRMNVTASIGATTREPEVRKWMARLDKEISAASEIQDRVMNSLACVLRDVTSTAENEDQPEEVLTPLANEIRKSVRSLETISAAYDAMLSRLEL